MARRTTLRSVPLAQQDDGRSETSTTSALLSRISSPSPPPSALDTWSDATPPPSSPLSASSSCHSSPDSSRHASPSSEDPNIQPVSCSPSRLTSRNLRCHNEQSALGSKFSPYLRSKSSRHKKAPSSHASSSSSPCRSSSCSSTSHFTNPTTPPDSRFGSPEVECAPAFLSPVPTFLSGYPGDPLAQSDDGFMQRYMGRAPRYGYEFGPRDIEFENMVRQTCVPAVQRQVLPEYPAHPTPQTNMMYPLPALPPRQQQTELELELDHDLDWNAFATELDNALAIWASVPKSKVKKTSVGLNGQWMHRAKLASF